MRLTHPLADRDAPTPAAITLDPGENIPVEDGVVDVDESDAERLRARWSDIYGGTGTTDLDPDLNDEAAAVLAEIEAAVEN